MAVIKCTVSRLPYSRHKLTYENEAVFFAYSYITTNSQTRANKLAILLGPWCRCHEPADGWPRLGAPPAHSCCSLRLQAGLLPFTKGGPQGEQSDASMWNLKLGTFQGGYLHPPGIGSQHGKVKRQRVFKPGKTGF